MAGICNYFSCLYKLKQKAQRREEAESQTVTHEEEKMHIIVGIHAMYEYL